ncbi:MAG: leucine-rich repeat domain-containing protein [Treponema sp.]|nr:leucine-rich repeat domain-containing protein [Treponema sp.]
MTGKTGPSRYGWHGLPSIGALAFIYCTSLSTLSLPEATSVGGWAFIECSSLTSLSLPQATGIGEYAFADLGSSSISISLAEAPGELWACSSLERTTPLIWHQE